MGKTSTGMEVVQEGSLREGLEAAIRERVRELIGLVLEEEVEAALGAGRSQRVAERVGYRHGSKPRRLTLRTGTIPLDVPRARLVEADGGEREWQSRLVPRYRRSSAEVEQSVLGVYLAGTNARRIRGALEPLLSGAALSKSAVSRLVLRLEESYRLWQQRDLAEERIVYLYLDAIYPKVRSGGKVVSLAVLVALGVRESGEKVLLSLTSAGAESADGWQLLLDDLAARKMGRPRLVIGDGNPGLGAALERSWPGVRLQRCTVHKLRNLLAKAPKHAHEAVREDYHRIVYAPSREAAVKAREAFLLKWRKLCPGVAASLEEAGENLLTFFEFPESQWLSLRTTNAIERMQQEFRRRVKTQAALPTEGAVLRVFFGLWISGQIKPRRIKGYRNIGGEEKVSA
ncbi:MAG TPA: IS256 family transposase [Patescibacteria group bacterium]|nr:IS256 family transposase [Patescibacteria group bacterium]